MESEKKNKDGLIPGQQVSFEEIVKIEAERKKVTKPKTTRRRKVKDGS